MSNEQEIAELEEIFRAANKKANVEPVFEDENGEEHYLPPEAIKVIEDILDSLFIPFLSAVVVAAGYRKAEKVRKETAKRIYQRLYDLCTKDNPFGAYDLLKEDVLCWVKEDGVEVDG